MNKKFIISTTNTIEGCPIKQYIDIVCSNVVIGTNLFSDFAASFTDFFGGKSGTYKRKMEIIYKEAYNELRQKAISLGANAIVGFKIDFDEISGKDKSMFMVSVSGTACIIENEQDEYDYSQTNRNYISQSEIQKEIERRYIVSKINNGIKLNSEWIEFLLENPQTEIIDSLISRYKELDVVINRETEEEIKNIENIIETIPEEKVIPIIYEHIKNKTTRRLINNCNLFDPEMILKKLPENLHEGIEILSASKKTYNISDLNCIKKILEYLENLPNTGKIETVKGGVLSRNYEEKFICENGHKNPKDAIFCEKCNINIKGLHENEFKIIDNLKERCNIIEDYINSRVH